MITALSTIKSWFMNGDKPTEKEFSNTWDSFWHKSEQIPRRVFNNPKEDFGLLLFTLKQSGDELPVIKILHSNFTYDPLWMMHYFGVGQYFVHSDEELTDWAEQSFFNTSQPDEKDIEITVKSFNPSMLLVTTKSNGMLADGLLDGSVLFTVRTRPGRYGY